MYVPMPRLVGIRETSCVEYREWEELSRSIVSSQTIEARSLQNVFAR
jgi:hypothetical protein